MNDCLPGMEHDYERVGYLVCSSKPNTNPKPIDPNTMVAGTLTWWGGSTINISGDWGGPVYLTADIEVHQCKNCGDIKFTPAVFHKIIGEVK